MKKAIFGTLNRVECGGRAPVEMEGSQKGPLTYKSIHMLTTNFGPNPIHMPSHSAISQPRHPAQGHGFGAGRISFPSIADSAWAWEPMGKGQVQSGVVTRIDWPHYVDL